MDIEKELLYEKGLESTEDAVEIMLYVFASFDIGIIIYSNFKFKSEKKGVKSLKEILCSFIIINIAMKFIDIKKIKYSKSSFYYELFLSVLSTAQFYLILTSLEVIFNATKVTRNIKFYNIISIFPLSIIFFFIAFSYDIFLSFYTNSKRIFGMIQYITAIICIYNLYGFINKRIIEIVDNSLKKRIIISKGFCFIILGAPHSTFILFFIYYAIKLFFLFVNNKFLFIYEIIILKIIQEGSKYFIYLILMIFLYSINEYNIRKEINNNNYRNNDEEEKVIINK